MPFAESLPAALAAQAAARPAEPWFFVPHGWDWSWAPWGEVAQQVGSWTGRLSALPAGSRVGFADRPWPRALVLDLAAQAAGLTSAPVPGLAAWAETGADLSGPDRLALLGCRAWVGPGDEVVPLGTERVGGEDRDRGGTGRASSGPEGSRRLDTFGEEGGSAVRAPGAVVVVGPGGPVVLSQADLLASARQMQARLAPDAERRGRREILVCGGSLADPSDRRLLSWALFSGAALVLEADPAAAVATAVWARPTLFQGGKGEIAALRRALEARSRRRGRLPFGRLHTVLVSGPAALPEGDLAFWGARGVRVAGVV